MPEAELVARIRLVLDVPFKYNVEDPDETGHTDSRVEAAKHAETEVLDKVVDMLSSGIKVVEELTLIEEVRENT